MKRLVARLPFLLLAAAGGAAPASAADPPDAERGRLLYENHCRFCHTPGIHARTRAAPLTHEGLNAIVMHWSRQQNLRWSAQDAGDVVEYLERTRYRRSETGGPGQ